MYRRSLRFRLHLSWSRGTGVGVKPEPSRDTKTGSLDGSEVSWWWWDRRTLTRVLRGVRDYIVFLIGPTQRLKVERNFDCPRDPVDLTDPFSQSTVLLAPNVLGRNCDSYP